jgi:hypothetical protein
MENVVNQTIEICIEEFQKDHNKRKLEENILDPVIKYISERLWPFIMYSIIFISLLLLLLFYIIYIIRKSNIKL